MLKVKELLEKRAKLWADASALNELATKEKRDLTGEESARFDAMTAEMDSIKAEADRLTKLDTIARELEAPIRPGFNPNPAGEPTERAADEPAKRKAAFSRWLRTGLEGLSLEERAAMFSAQSEDPEVRAQSAVTGNVGGYNVPQDFANQLDIALKMYGPMLQVAETIDSSTGATMPYPSVNDTAVAGAILAENTVFPAVADISFGVVNFGAYMYTSKPVLVPFQLIQDSATDIDSLVAGLLGERLGRILNTHFTVGTGSGQPTGILAASGAATLGKAGTTGQTTSIIWDDIIDLVHSVDAAYRPRGAFMMNDLSIAIVRKLKEGTTGRPLWEPSVQVGQPDRLVGYPVYANNDVPVMGVSAKSVVFGDLSKYKVRRVRNVSLLRLVERYADYLQVGFIAYCRFDGKLIDAGTHPVTYYQNSSS